VANIFKEKPAAGSKFKGFFWVKSSIEAMSPTLARVVVLVIKFLLFMVLGFLS
jgi:hypothetical protein